jgi:hypothetical protein
MIIGGHRHISYHYPLIGEGVERTTCAGILKTNDSHFSCIFTVNVATSAYILIFDLRGERFARTTSAAVVRTDGLIPAMLMAIGVRGDCAYPLEVEEE